MESETATDLLRALILRHGLASDYELRSWLNYQSHDLLAELIRLRRLTHESARMLSLEAQNQATPASDDQETLRLHKSESAWQFPLESAKSEGEEETRRANPRPASTRSKTTQTSRIGPYEIVRELGKGGASVVYEARLNPNAPSIALKVLTQQALWGEADKRLRRESELLRRLRHPNIVRVFDENFGDEPQYIAMELLDTSLEIEIKNKGPLPIYRVLTIARVLCDALQHAHSRGVLHRDLKPANILLTSRSEPVIADFGLAKEVGPQGDGSGVSIQGSILGTPAYMSPEQANGEDATVRSDLYSLGALIYAMLAGRAPYQGSRPEQVLAQIFTWDPPQLSELRQGLPAGLDTVIHRAMARDPEQRFETAEAFRQALAAWDPRGPQASSISQRTPALDKGARGPVKIFTALTGSVAMLLFFSFGLSILFRNEALREQLKAQENQLRDQKAQVREQELALLDLKVRALITESAQLGPARPERLQDLLAAAEQQGEAEQLLKILRLSLDPWSRFVDLAAWPTLIEGPLRLFARSPEVLARIEFARAAQLELLGERELALASLDACLKSKKWQCGEALLLNIYLTGLKSDLSSTGENPDELKALQSDFDDLLRRAPKELPDLTRDLIRIELSERQALLARQPELAVELGQRAFYERLSLIRKGQSQAWLSLGESLDRFRQISLKTRPELMRRACDSVLSLTRAEMDTNPAALAPRFVFVRALQNRALIYQSQDARPAAIEDLKEASAALELIRRSAPDPLALPILNLDIAMLRAELGDSQVATEQIENIRQDLLARWPQSASPRPLAKREDLHRLLQTILGRSSLPWP